MPGPLLSKRIRPVLVPLTFTRPVSSVAVFRAPFSERETEAQGGVSIGLGSYSS